MTWPELTGHLKALNRRRDPRGSTDRWDDAAKADPFFANVYGARRAR